MINKDNLDERICDIEPGANNPETYREYIRITEKEFNICYAPIDSMDEEELSSYLNFMDELWEK